MTYHVDNQPSYITSNRPPYKAIDFAIIAQGEAICTDEDDYCEPLAQTFFVDVLTANGDLDERDMKALIARGLTPERCYCEHDCCGHRHGYATVELLTMQTARATVYTSCNY